MALEKVIYRPAFDSDIDSRRTVVGVLSKPHENPIVIEQARVMLVREDNNQLGNHYRDYGEMYGVIGQAEFTLEDISTRDRRVFPMSTGDQLFIPSQTAVRIGAKKGTVIICCSERYNRQAGTHRYQVD
jgi:hypothetical protein